MLGPLLVTALATGYNLYQELMRTPPAGPGSGAQTPGGSRANVTAARRRAVSAAAAAANATVTSPAAGAARSRRDFGGLGLVRAQMTDALG